MKKHKNSIIAGLTVIAIILCGLLPHIIAVVEDYFADQRVAYGESKTVSLIRELNDVEKMYLLKTGTEVSISEDRANLKSADMMEVLESALSRYTQNAFFVGEISDFSIVDCEPVLYYSSEISNLSGIFWKINMELWDYFGQSISLYLDDQTGKVLLISYDCLETVYEKDALEVHMMSLFDTYQSQRNWQGAEYEPEENVEPVEYKNKREMIYRIGDKVYGEICIRFIMTKTGFCIALE